MSVDGGTKNVRLDPVFRLLNELAAEVTSTRSSPSTVVCARARPGGIATAAATMPIAAANRPTRKNLLPSRNFIDATFVQL